MEAMSPCICCILLRVQVKSVVVPVTVKVDSTRRPLETESKLAGKRIGMHPRLIGAWISRGVL
jgi:hypothetical protein